MYSANTYLPWKDDYVAGKGLLNEWQAMAFIIVALAPLVVLTIYSLHKLFSIFRFLYVYYVRGEHYTPKQGVIPEGEEPLVSLMISCYNEAQVIRRTIDHACSIDWPLDKLEVCVLDDSTDITKEITDEAAAEWRERGVNCRVIRRQNREGYKAGNLHYAQDMITGNYHALFDSDHMPTKHFLRSCMPHFYDQEGNAKEEIGLVQAPWGYYNIKSNMLTQSDALMLDVHHVIEQRGRGRCLGMFSFNGTGGVWRREAIQAGGGWTWDTVTEDLDLSYRACLNGFRFVYVEDGPCGLEIPANISAFKSQKYRWDQGYAQVTKKSLIDLITYPGATFWQKMEVFFHLTGGFQYPMTMWILVFIPWLSYFEILPLAALLMMAIIVFIIIFQITLAIALKPAYNGDYEGFNRLSRFLYLIPAMMLNIGMNVNATMAVLAGLFKQGAVFIRTPKEGSNGASSDGGSHDQDSDVARSEAASEDNSLMNSPGRQNGVATVAGADGMMAPMSTMPTAGEVADAKKKQDQQNGVKSIKKKFVENRRKRRNLPKYETKMDLKWSTRIEVLLAIYYLVWVGYLFPSANENFDVAQLFILFIPAIAYTVFAFTAVVDYTKHTRKRLSQQMSNSWNYYSYYLACCCLCGNVDDNNKKASVSGEASTSFEQEGLTTV